MPQMQKCGKMGPVINRNSPEIMWMMELADENVQTATEIVFMERVDPGVNRWGI